MLQIHECIKVTGSKSCVQLNKTSSSVAFWCSNGEESPIK